MRNALRPLCEAYRNNKDFYETQWNRLRRAGMLGGCFLLSVLLVWRCNDLNDGLLFEHSPDGVLVSAAMTGLTVLTLLATTVALLNRSREQENE